MTALELFEKFLKQDEQSNYTYHLQPVEELRGERQDVQESIDDIHESLKWAMTETEVDELKGELEGLDASRDRMDRVLAFVGDATEGSLITKVNSTLEWEYQEPIYFTTDDGLANKAFAFFNAHAVITAQS